MDSTLEPALTRIELVCCQVHRLYIIVRINLRKQTGCTITGYIILFSDVGRVGSGPESSDVKTDLNVSFKASTFFIGVAATPSGICNELIPV